MSWFDWLRPKSEGTARKTPSPASAGRPIADQNIVDLRSPQAREAATAAKYNLCGDDEEIAMQWVSLVGQITASDWVRATLEGDPAYKRIGQIGEQLDNNGGISRMRRVGYRVKALGGNARLLGDFMA